MKMKDNILSRNFCIISNSARNN